MRSRIPESTRVFVPFCSFVRSHARSLVVSLPPPPSAATAPYELPQAMFEAEAAAAACCIQRMARQVHTEKQQRQVADLLHRKRHERYQIALQDEAFEEQDSSGRSDPGLASEAHLEPRPPAEALLKHEEHRGVRLEERLRELQRVVDAERWRVEKRLEREAGGEALELSASTESLPSSAAFDDSAISSEGEESEEGCEAGEAGEGGEAGGERQAGRAEADRCEGAEPARWDPKHRASLEEFTLLERACREEPAVNGMRCEEPAVNGTRCEEQGSRDLSDRGDGNQP